MDPGMEPRNSKRPPQGQCFCFAERVRLVVAVAAAAAVW